MRNRHEEFESHIERIDSALLDDPSPSEVSSLLRERRATLNALESLDIVQGASPADEVKRKREQRRAQVAKKAP